MPDLKAGPVDLKDALASTETFYRRAEDSGGLVYGCLLFGKAHVSIGRPNEGEPRESEWKINRILDILSEELS